MKRLDLKQEERLYVTKYMEYKYNHTPSFKLSGLDIPDCYFSYNEKFYAVEVTRYFQQNSEKEHIICVRDLEKYLEKDDFFEQVYNRLGKRKFDDLTISFYDVNELYSMVLNNIKFIKNISIGNNYYFNKNDEYNDVLCIGLEKEKMKITEFMDFVKKDIINEQAVELDVLTKNNSEISFSFKFCKHPYYGKLNDKKVIPIFCWWENQEELYNNIIDAIKGKNQKLINEYAMKLKDNNVNYDYYNLVVYSEGIPAEVDEKNLYNLVINIENLKYDEIVIFLWKKLIVINNKGFEIYETN